MVFSKNRVLLVGAVILVLTWVVMAGCGGADTSTTTAGGVATTSGEGTETTGAAETETFELKVAHYFPATHPIETQLVKAWGDAVSEATGGNVTIVSYPGQTLLKGPEIYDGITKGVADVGIMAYGFNKGRFPVVEAFMLPGADFGDSATAGKILAEGLELLDPEELKDTHHLMSFSSGSGKLLTKTPVRTLDDLSGLEIAATSGVVGQALGLLGATPVVMPVGDIYEAQSRGVVVGTEIGYEALKGFKLMDVTDYITATPLLYRAHFVMTMNKDLWDSMPESYQTAITEATAKVRDDIALGLFDTLDEGAIKATMEQSDPPEMITLSAEQEQIWKDKIAPIWSEYEADLNGRGLDGKAILETVKELAAKYNTQ
ncbi:MAG: TRAP transporter substrate-binding protein [Thermoleophilia bacterium]